MLKYDEISFAVRISGNSLNFVIFIPPFNLVYYTTQHKQKNKCLKFICSGLTVMIQFLCTESNSFNENKIFNSERIKFKWIKKNSVNILPTLEKKVGLKVKGNSQAHLELIMQLLLE